MSRTHFQAVVGALRRGGIPFARRKSQGRAARPGAHRRRRRRVEAHAPRRHLHAQPHQPDRGRPFRVPDDGLGEVEENFGPFRHVSEVRT